MKTHPISSLSCCPKRVVVFAAHFYPHLGGVERYSRELWSRLAQRGWTVVLVTGNTNQAQHYEVIDGLHVLRLPVFMAVNGQLPILKPGAALRDTWRSLTAFNPQVVVTNTRFFSTSAFGCLLAGRLKVPFLHIEHGSQHVPMGSALGNALSSLVDHTMGSWIVRRADRCVGVSKAVGEFLIHLGARNSGLLYNGVNASAAASAEGSSWRKRLAIAEDSLLILYVGRLIEAKGVLHLVEAFTSLSPDLKAHLVLAGGGPLLPLLQNRTNGLERVQLLGAVPPEQVPSLIAAADIFTHPSACAEGLPTSVLEAAAAGKPVIATPMGGTVEVIQDGQTGLLVPPSEPRPLGGAIDTLARNRDLRTSFGQRAQMLVQERFDWEAISDVAERELSALLTPTPMKVNA